MPRVNDAEIHQEAVDNSGATTWRYCQDDPLTWNIRNEEGYELTRNGICMAMSADWIIERLIDNQSLKKKITTDPAPAAPVIEDRIKEIAATQQAILSAPDWMQAKISYYQNRNVTLNKSITYEPERRHSTHWQFIPFSLAALEGTMSMMFVDVDSLVGELVIGEYSGPQQAVISSAHSMAFYFDKSQQPNKYIYFDSNYGEFAFIDYEKFQAWFRKFYELAYRNLNCSGYQISLFKMV